MRFRFVIAVLVAGTAPSAPAPPTLAQPSPSVSVPAEVFSDKRRREVLVAQVLLDRGRHSPGVVDGYMGGNTARAIRAFQRANGIAEDGMVSEELLRRLGAGNSGEILQRYTLTAEDVSGPFVDVPGSMAGMARLDRVAYGSPAEKIAEKFHMSRRFLRKLNPGADFGSAGTEITVIALGGGGLQRDVARIEVDKANNAVRAYAEDGTWLASYPATVGSSTFPSPSGSMTVRAVAPEAAYYFDPQGREWGPDQQLTIPAGPNNPVGGIWIDLSKSGYGIHGSPDPRLIGKTASHGCVRLTNWDARELAEAVSPGTKVEFV